MSAVRWSCQLTSGLTGSPVVASQRTSDSRWPLMHRPAMREGLMSSMIVATARRALSMISSADCSTQPGRGYVVVTGEVTVLRTSLCWSTSRALVEVEPWSRVSRRSASGMVDHLSGRVRDALGGQAEVAEQEIGAAGGRELARDSEDARGDGLVLDEQGSDGRAEPSGGGGFLDRDHGPGFRGCLQDGFAVQGLDRGHVDDPQVDALLVQQICCLEGPGHHGARGDNGGAVAGSDLDTAAEDELSLFRADGRDGMPPDAQVGRAVVARRPPHGGAGLAGIRGDDDRQAGDGAKPGEVLDGMVGGAEFPVGHSRTLPAEDDMGAAVGDVGLDLFQGAAGEERGGRADEGDHPAVGEARADPDKILLGDADVDEPAGKLLPESHQVAGADRIVADGDDALVLPGQRDEFLSECLTAVVGGGVEDCLRGHAVSSSRAARIWSGLGTLWCHSTRSSMKDTPLPFVVLAMTHTGRPDDEGSRLDRIWAWWCPSMTRTSQPKLAHLSASGSSCFVSSVRAPCWSRLRSTMAVSEASA